MKKFILNRSRFGLLALSLLTVLAISPPAFAGEGGHGEQKHIEEKSSSNHKDKEEHKDKDKHEEQKEKQHDDHDEHDNHEGESAK